MNITEKTQTQTDIDNLEKRIGKTVSALEFTATQLNLAYYSIWNLPEDRLQALLQVLVNTGKLAEVFSVHAKSAAYLNELLEAAGEKYRVITQAARQFEIGEDGIVSLIPQKQPDIEIVGEEIIE